MKNISLQTAENVIKYKRMGISVLKRVKIKFYISEVTTNGKEDPC
jgi:hypothetical protein